MNPNPTLTASSLFSPSSDAVLLGNSFPLSLIRRPVRIEPVAVGTVREAVRARPVVSFWGHTTTMVHAGGLLGVDLTPVSERPALTLDPEGYPVLERRVFKECFVLSPEFVSGYRPAIGEDVPADRITGWQSVHLVWE